MLHQEWRERGKLIEPEIDLKLKKLQQVKDRSCQTDGATLGCELKRGV